MCIHTDTHTNDKNTTHRHCSQIRLFKQSWTLTIASVLLWSKDGLSRSSLMSPCSVDDRFNKNDSIKTMMEFRDEWAIRRVWVWEWHYKPYQSASWILIRRLNVREMLKSLEGALDIKDQHLPVACLFVGFRHIH